MRSLAHILIRFFPPQTSGSFRFVTDSMKIQQSFPDSGGNEKVTSSWVTGTLYPQAGGTLRAEGRHPGEGRGAASGDKNGNEPHRAGFFLEPKHQGRKWALCAGDPRWLPGKPSPTALYHPENISDCLRALGARPFSGHGVRLQSP